MPPPHLGKVGGPAWHFAPDQYRARGLNLPLPLPPLFGLGRLLQLSSAHVRGHLRASSAPERGRKGESE
eukprot:2086516-Rhodomonas_salina.1